MKGALDHGLLIEYLGGMKCEGLSQIWWCVQRHCYTPYLRPSLGKGSLMNRLMKRKWLLVHY